MPVLRVRLEASVHNVRFSTAHGQLMEPLCQRPVIEYNKIPAERSAGIVV